MRRSGGRGVLDLFLTAIDDISLCPNVPLILGASLLKEILRQAGISSEDWDKL
jgi:hypothetical protein